jgi:hypothetical protein
MGPPPAGHTGTVPAMAGLLWNSDLSDGDPDGPLRLGGARHAASGCQRVAYRAVSVRHPLTGSPMRRR